jgi:hypothetical protein
MSVFLYFILRIICLACFNINRGAYVLERAEVLNLQYGQTLQALTSVPLVCFQLHYGVNITPLFSVSENLFMMVYAHIT